MSGRPVHVRTIRVEAWKTGEDELEVRGTLVEGAWRGLEIPGRIDRHRQLEEGGN